MKAPLGLADRLTETGCLFYFVVDFYTTVTVEELTNWWVLIQSFYFDLGGEWYAWAQKPWTDGDGFRWSICDLIPDDHILMRVDNVLDLSWLAGEVADCYSTPQSPEYQSRSCGAPDVRGIALWYLSTTAV